MPEARARRVGTCVRRRRILGMGGDKVEGAAIGIDLGNCYTAVGVFRNDRFEIIPNEQGNSTTPSFVSFTDTGRLLGDAAKSRAAANPTNTITNAKRFLGLQADMPQHRDVPFKGFSAGESLARHHGAPAFQLGSEKTFFVYLVLRPRSGCRTNLVSQAVGVWVWVEAGHVGHGSDAAQARHSL